MQIQVWCFIEETGKQIQNVKQKDVKSGRQIVRQTYSSKGKSKKSKNIQKQDKIKNQNIKLQGARLETSEVQVVAHWALFHPEPRTIRA